MFSSKIACYALLVITFLAASSNHGQGFAYAAEKELRLNNYDKEAKLIVKKSEPFTVQINPGTDYSEHTKDKKKFDIVVGSCTMNIAAFSDNGQEIYYKVDGLHPDLINPTAFTVDSSNGLKFVGKSGGGKIFCGRDQILFEKHLKKNDTFLVELKLKGDIPKDLLLTSDKKAYVAPEDEATGGLSKAARIAIGVGVPVFLLIICIVVIFLICCCIRRQKRKREEERQRLMQEAQASNVTSVAVVKDEEQKRRKTDSGEKKSEAKTEDKTEGSSKAKPVASARMETAPKPQQIVVAIPAPVATAKPKTTATKTTVTKTQATKDDPKSTGNDLEQAGVEVKENPNKSVAVNYF